MPDSLDALPVLPPDAVREAMTYARAHGAPLLRRMCEPSSAEGVIVAWDFFDGTYQLAAVEVASGRCSRRVHLEWVRTRMADEDPPEELYRTLGDAYVEAAVDAAAKASDAACALDDRTYARVYGGPHTGSEKQIGNWLKQQVDIFELDSEHAEALLSFLETHSAAASGLAQLLSRAGGAMQWRDPDSGEEIGRVAEVTAPGYDVTLNVTSAAALTCLQWTADLLGVPLRFEVQSE